MNVRTPALGLLCAVGLLVAGCGGGPAASSESGASLVRSDALAYVSVDTDLGSAQWKQLDDLSHRFPGRELAVSKLEQALAKNGVDYEGDVEPALGPEVDVAVVSAGTKDTTKVVGLTQPQDPAKLVELVAKLNATSSNKHVVYRELDNGWYAMSDSQAAIDQALAGDGPTLDGESTFTDALSKLPGEALVKAYANGHQLAQLAASARRTRAEVRSARRWPRSRSSTPSLLRSAPRTTAFGCTAPRRALERRRFSAEATSTRSCSRTRPAMLSPS